MNEIVHTNNKNFNNSNVLSLVTYTTHIIDYILFFILFNKIPNLLFWKHTFKVRLHFTDCFISNKKYLQQLLTECSL